MQMREEKNPLEAYTRNLTKEAEAGKLDPVIGRDEEIRRAMQVLSRRTKNNPILIGDPGVGKTAIAEGIARRIASGDVPDSLKNKALLSLDLASLVAGAKFRGEFEERLKNLLKALDDTAGQTILFIDEIHTMVGAGSVEGSMDASNMLKPALAKGSLRCVGATTLDEYRKYIEKDAALERRFQSIYVKEPNMDDTIAILRGLKSRYEIHHGLRITDAAIVSACNMAERYLSGRKQPDKSIDLIDEAASALKLQIESVPKEIDEIERRCTRLEIARQAFIREKDAASKKRLAEIEPELKTLRNKAQTQRAKWDKERAVITSIKTLKEKAESLKHEMDTAQREGNFEKAARIQYSDLRDLEKDLLAKEAALKKAQEAGTFLREEVTEEDIALVLSRWTGIPVTKMLEGDKERLLKMEERLQNRVVGQKEAISAVSRAIRRSRTGLSDESKPQGTFLFLGPTGVGKTELARALAEFLFDDEKALVRIDMSEYMEKHAVARLIGAPPGYVGFEEGGQLTEAVRRRPYSVILLDEVEKAHPEVFHVLLQLLDDGRLTDGKGRTVDFKNTIILMTSNIGSEHLVNSQNEAENKTLVDALLKQFFRPEFLNRLDEVLYFHALSESDLEKILDIQLESLKKVLAKKDITLTIDSKAKKHLAKQGYDPQYGARPLKRVIQKELLDLLSESLLKGETLPGETIKVSCGEEGIRLS